jgi:hypothetical protein
VTMVDRRWWVGEKRAALPWVWILDIGACIDDDV